MVLRKLLYSALLFVFVVSFGCGGGKQEEQPAPAQPSTTAPSAGSNAFDASKATATVTGKATFDGTKPTLAKLPLTPECQQLHAGKPVVEEWAKVNDDGTLQDVLVYVKEGAEKWTYQTPTDPILLDQVGCHYVPHVVAMMPNQPLKIRNSDPFLHNIHPQPANNPAFNMGQPVKGMENEKTFSNAEIAIPVKCDVHRWMSSYIAVVGNPFYAVTGSDGSFNVKLPAGTYTLEAWHEKFGAQTQQVTVTDGESKDVTFTFKAS
jgi:hypothetical protein